MDNLESFFVAAANFVWGTPLLILLLGGGTFFMVYSRFLPFRYLGHAINVLRGKYDDKDDPGEINHFQALSGALAATIGMGNISGVAVAIATGGPGAIFWMWVSAFFGMATKFFTCTLAVMYRGKDKAGQVQGGPMYFISEGLGKKWMPLAIFFAVVGSFGATPIFQTHQTIDAIKDVVLIPMGLETGFYADLIMGILIAILIALVIFGGVTRIGSVASRLVPSMVVLYVGSVIVILLMNLSELWSSLVLIVTDAFTAKAAMGGMVGALILTGARRAAFSNEAGVGTAPLMHGAAKTKEPVREGLVAMLGPAIDTLLICTMTGLAILVTDAWKSGDLNGITLTAKAFEISLPVIGPYILLLCVVIFAITTIFGLGYYGKKCFSFLVGPRIGEYFNFWYVALIIVGAVATLDAIVAFIDMSYGLMAFPTMISAILLAPKVRLAAKQYFQGVNGEKT
ncbi:sodium:alanine symporter family protein [Marinoscillum sp. MHG1-6]|uniref:alanine/glycine:cation symporter family protein n=1 Tax=Marinoscillum sp. MHG1-6 TaxID=2959627 RepID=UPI00215793A8|nr:alanine/glycine:cation symporter family protein [Marinoscillum sp. MHG1-6]